MYCIHQRSEREDSGWNVCEKYWITGVCNSQRRSDFVILCWSQQNVGARSASKQRAKLILMAVSKFLCFSSASLIATVKSVAIKGGAANGCCETKY